MQLKIHADQTTCVTIIYFVLLFVDFDLPFKLNVCKVAQSFSLAILIMGEMANVGL